MIYLSAADYVVKGSFGTKTANVDAGADARDVAKGFNLISGTTGVQQLLLLEQRFQVNRC